MQNIKFCVASAAIMWMDKGVRFTIAKTKSSLEEQQYKPARSIQSEHKEQIFHQLS